MRSVVLLVGLLILGVIQTTGSFGAERPASRSTRYEPDIARAVRTVLVKADKNVNLAKVKLTFDKFVDPKIDVQQSLRQIDQMARSVSVMAGPAASNDQKLTALRRYIYEAGDWNGHKPFSYDLTDPLGTTIANKLLPTYLSRRRGNCVSMPFLFIILADRLELKVTASVAPSHVFVKYTDDITGKLYNLETTSGGHPARDVWYRQNMPMTDEAIRNGVYLRPLTKKETLALMASTVMEHLLAVGRYQDANRVAAVILEFYPTFVGAMVSQAEASIRLIEDSYGARYPSLQHLPRDVRIQYQTLIEAMSEPIRRAEGLGWRHTDGQK